MNLRRIIKLTKIKRWIKAIKYIIQAIAIFKRDVFPIIRSYYQNVILLIKDLRQTEKLEEKIKNDNSSTEK